MEHHIQRKAVPGTPSRYSSLAISPISKPGSQRTQTSRASSDIDTSLRQSLISRFFSHDEADQMEHHPRKPFVSRHSSDKKRVPRQLAPDYSYLPGDPPPDMGSRPPAKHAARMLDKLGRWPATLVVLCLVLLATSAGFLSWIWFARRDDARWRSLMLGPYSNVAVTISTFVVRLAVAGITWVTVAMMASVLVERHGVPEGKMAEASMARYTGSVISLAFDGFTLKTSWFRILVPLQVVCAVVSQLSSTLLFSDFRDVLLPGFPVETSVKYDFDNPGFSKTDGDFSDFENPIKGFAGNWHRSQPSTFEPFAEHARPEERIVGDAVDDTGPIWRALLPLGAYDNNTSIHEYSGVARVFDARTICVRPEIQTFNMKGVGDDTLRTLTWVGKVRIDASSVPDVLDAGDDGVFEEDFACSFPFDMIDMTRATRPIMSQCQVGNIDVVSIQPKHHRIPTLDPLFYNRSAIETLHDEWVAGSNGTAGQRESGGGAVSASGDESPKSRILWTRTGQSHILLEANYHQANWYSEMADDTVKGKTDALNMSIVTSIGEGPWQTFEVEVEDDDTKLIGLPSDLGRSIPMRATYCWDVMSHGNAPVPYLNITATNEATMSPPVTYWNESAVRYLTSDVRHQLGVTTNPEQRAVFALTRQSLEDAINREVKPADVASHVLGLNTKVTDASAYRTYLANTGLLVFDSYENDIGTHVFWTNLLTDVIADTGSPALGIQAVNTAAARMIYAQWIGSFTAGAEARITHLTGYRVPVAVAGYSVTMVVIAAQVALLIVVGAMFRSCTNSVLNDAWLVVSQVSSSQGAVGELVREKDVTDAEVKAFVGEEKSGAARRRLVVRDGAFREPDGV